MGQLLSMGPMRPDLPSGKKSTTAFPAMENVRRTRSSYEGFLRQNLDSKSPFCGVHLENSIPLEIGLGVAVACPASEIRIDSTANEASMSLLEPVSYCDFLRNMPGELVVRLGRIAHARAYAASEVLFSEGTEHPEFHVVVEGHVRLDMFVPRRGRVPILTAGPGDVLAWSALAGNSIMTSTAVALEAVRTVAFPSDQLQRLCETEHDIGYHVMRQLASALSRRLLATRLQLLDLFGEHVAVLERSTETGRPGDPEC